MDSFTMREQARGAADPAVCDVPTCIENEDAESSRNACSRAVSTSNNGGQPGVPQSADDADPSGREPRRFRRDDSGRNDSVDGSQRRWTREQFLQVHDWSFSAAHSSDGELPGSSPLAERSGCDCSEHPAQSLYHWAAVDAAVTVGVTMEKQIGGGYNTPPVSFN